MKLLNDEIFTKKKTSSNHSMVLGKTCSYCSDACVNNALRNQIIEGLLYGDTVKELLRQKTLTLERTKQICRAHEAAFAATQRN